MMVTRHAAGGRPTGPGCAAGGLGQILYRPVSKGRFVLIHDGSRPGEIFADRKSAAGMPMKTAPWAVAEQPRPLL